MVSRAGSPGISQQSTPLINMRGDPLVTSVSQKRRSAVAFKERVDGLKLHMRQGRLEEERRVHRLVMEEQFQRVHAGRDMLGRRRYEGGVAGARAADPVLAGTEFAGVLAAAAALHQLYGVDLAEQSQTSGRLKSILCCRLAPGMPFL